MSVRNLQYTWYLKQLTKIFNNFFFKYITYYLFSFQKIKNVETITLKITIKNSHTHIHSASYMDHKSDIFGL